MNYRSTKTGRNLLAETITVYMANGRLTFHSDVGNAVLLLCSEEAGWITGQVIAVDGGSSLMDMVFPLEIQRG